jgi:hypothetical protein
MTYLGYGTAEHVPVTFDGLLRAWRVHVVALSDSDVGSLNSVAYDKIMVLA